MVDKKAKKLNIQGIGRNEKDLLKNLVADPGKVFVEQDLCFTPDTEILTPRGWVCFADLTNEDLVCQVDKATLSPEFVAPLRIVDKHYTGDLITYKARNQEITATEGHTALWVGQQNHKTRPDKGLRRKVGLFGEDPGIGWCLPKFTVDNTTSDFAEEDIWRVCALQADSCMNRQREYTYKIEVSKPRKREKLRELFGEGVVAKEIRDRQTMINERWNAIYFRHALLSGKHFNLSHLGSNQAGIFFEALCFWDGGFVGQNKETGNFSWVTVDKKTADDVQIYAARSGYSCDIRVTTPKNKKHSPFYTLQIKKNGAPRFMLADHHKHAAPSGSLEGSKIIRTKYSGRVCCVTVPSGFILIRQNGQPYISGNCGAEPRVISHYSKDPNYAFVNLPGEEKIKEILVEGRPAILLKGDPYLTGASISGLFTEDFWEVYKNGINGESFAYLWENNPEAIKKALSKCRKINKMCVLAQGYSAQGQKIKDQAKQQANIDISLEAAEQSVKSFWAMYAGVKSFSDSCKKVCKRQGGWMKNDFGFRGFPKRDGAAFNWLIQSTISCAMDFLIGYIRQTSKVSEFSTVIHDAVIWQVREEEIEAHKEASDRAVKALNDMVGWDTEFELGCSVGKTWADLK